MLGGDRTWTLAGGLAVRASGFLGSFALARYAGAHVLGQYSTVLNTAGAVATPLLVMLVQAAALQGSRAGATGLASLARVYTRITLRLSLLACAAFVGLYLTTEAAGTLPASLHAIAIAAGFASVIGQLVAYSLQSLYVGAGHVRLPSLAAIAVSLAATAAVLPSAIAFGIAGALVVAAAAALLHPLVLRLRAPGASGPDAGAHDEARALLRQSWGLAGATVVASVTSWFTLVFAVGRAHGDAGVGLCAVGMQWTTLLVLAVTSWSGVTIRVLSAALAASDRSRLRATVASLVAKHLAITGVGAAGVLLAAERIAALYGMADTALPTILRVNAAAALVLACTNVFERLLFCTGAQRLAVRASIAGSAVQVAVVLLFVQRSPIVAPLAMLASPLVSLAIQMLAARDQWSGRA